MKRRSASPVVPARHERIRRLLEELESFRPLHSSDSGQVELPADFLQTFERVKQEEGIEAARCYEAETLRRVALAGPQ